VAFLENWLNGEADERTALHLTPPEVGQSCLNKDLNEALSRRDERWKKVRKHMLHLTEQNHLPVGMHAACRKAGTSCLIRPVYAYEHWNVKELHAAWSGWLAAHNAQNLILFTTLTLPAQEAERASWRMPGEMVQRGEQEVLHIVCWMTLKPTELQKIANKQEHDQGPSPRCVDAPL